MTNQQVSFSRKVLKKFLLPSEMAEILNQETNDEWSAQQVNKELESAGLQYLDSFKQWQRTDFCLSFPNYCQESRSGFKWNRELIELIIMKKYRPDVGHRLKQIGLGWKN